MRMSTAQNDAPILERPVGAARANASDHEQILPLVLDFPKSYSGLSDRRVLSTAFDRLSNQG
jgi:hypothetical protein